MATSGTDCRIARCCYRPEREASAGVTDGAASSAMEPEQNSHPGATREAATWLPPFPSGSSLKLDPDFRFERGVFAGLENCVTIRRFGFVVVRGLRPAPARDGRQVRDQSERGTACRSARYSARRGTCRRRERSVGGGHSGDGQQIWQGLGRQREPVDCASRETGGGGGRPSER